MTHIPLWFIVKDMPESAFVRPNKLIFDFILQGVTEEESNEVGMTWDNAIEIQPHWTMAHIAVAMGHFPSVGQAKKNGWNQPIEFGYSERGGVGKKNLCFFIFNPRPQFHYSKEENKLDDEQIYTKSVQAAKDFVQEYEDDLKELASF
jgi:hypothetical protein